MPFRRTRTITSDSDHLDPLLEADVIMTGALLGFAASNVRDGVPVRFDIDPKSSDGEWTSFQAVVGKIGAATIDFLRSRRLEPPGKVSAGLAPDFDKGAVIVGVYHLAGQKAPVSVRDPQMSAKGRALYEKIINEELPQYTGRGAYTGFVDNHNTEGNTDPVGPRSTARFLTPQRGGPPSGNPSLAEPHPRWLPAGNSPVWRSRIRRGTADSCVPWGLIGGDAASQPPDPSSFGAGAFTNRADQITAQMKEAGMVFLGEPGTGDIAAYTHGLVQAVYKAYSLGPSCTPYEIAVGKVTTKLASCLACTLFIDAQGYPPTAIHLGRGESWAPLYYPYNPEGSAEFNEAAVIRDLNNSWSAKCAEYLPLGLEMLDDRHLAADHIPARDAVMEYLEANRSDSSTSAALVLDALTVHENDSVRADRTLRAV